MGLDRLARISDRVEKGLHADNEDLIKTIYAARDRIWKRARRIIAEQRGCLEHEVNWERPGWHAFRHTVATRAALAGMPVHLLKRIMGHANIKTTLEYYTHVTDGDAAVIRGVMERTGIAEATGDQRIAAAG